MSDIEGNDNAIYIYAYPDFLKYKGEGVPEHSAIQWIWLYGKNVYLKGIFKNNNFLDYVKVPLLGIDLQNSVTLAD